MRSDVVELVVAVLAGILARPRPAKDEDLKEDPTTGCDGAKPDTTDTSADAVTRQRQARLVERDKTIVEPFFCRKIQLGETFQDEGAQGLLICG